MADDHEPLDEETTASLLRDAAAGYAPPADLRTRIEERARRQDQRARSLRALAMVAAVVVLLAGVAAIASGRGAQEDTVTMPPGSGSVMVPGTPGTPPRGTVFELPCAATTVPGMSCPWHWVDVPPETETEVGITVATGAGPALPTDPRCPDGRVLLAAFIAPNAAPATDGATDTATSAATPSSPVAPTTVTPSTSELLGGGLPVLVSPLACIDGWARADVIWRAPPVQQNEQAIFRRGEDGAWHVFSEGTGGICESVPTDIATTLCAGTSPGDLYAGGLVIVGTDCTQVPATTMLGDKSGGHILCDHSPSSSTTTTPEPTADAGLLRGRVIGAQGLPLPSLIDVAGFSGEFAVATGPDGSWGIALPPGTYQLTVVVNRDVGMACTPNLNTVDVVAGQSLVNDVTCTSGG